MAVSTGTLPLKPHPASAVAPAARGRDQVSAQPFARAIGATAAQEQELRARNRWEALRGQVLVTVPVTLVGSFPGSLAHQQMLERAELSVSEFFFTVNEGTDFGFAIPADDIVDLTIVPDPAGSMRALRIRYVADQADGCIQAFTIATTGFRRVARFKTILRLAAADDIEVAAWDPVADRPRSLAVTWAHVRRFSSELMVWSGTACGPVGGWLASARAECRVWMTTHSFFWCDVSGEGVNRVPVADILDVTMDLGADTPVVALALRDAEGCRQELLFGFDRREFGDRAEATCRSLVEALKEYGVPTRHEMPVFAPWLPGQAIDLPQRMLPVAVPTAPAPVRRPRTAPVEAVAPAVPKDVAMPAEVLAWLDGLDEPSPPIGKVIPFPTAGRTVATEDSEPVAVLNVDVESKPEPVAPTPELTPLEQMAAFEDACLAAIRNTATTTVAPDLGTRLTDALAALTTLIETGEIELIDANVRAQRMRGLADCQTALASLARQQQTGKRSLTAIIAERKTVLNRVADLTA